MHHYEVHVSDELSKASTGEQRATGQATVLVVTQRIDPTADLVVTELQRRGATVARCDIADFPQQLQLATTLNGDRWGGELRSDTWRIDLATITGAYYRRPTHIQISDELAADDQRWASTEAMSGFGGVLASIDTWLNHPARIGFAEYKPVQLEYAAKAGLATPRTMITNDPAAAAQFVRENKDVVYKAFSSAVTVEDERQFVYAQRLDAEPDESVRHTAHLFQHWVDKQCDVRVTAVDGQIFAARIDADSDAARTDWRADYKKLRYSVIDPPRSIVDGISVLLGSLGLRFGALDFAVNKAGEWVFLDLNPNGQWSWIEHETGLPICAAIAAALLGQPVH